MAVCLPFIPFKLPWVYSTMLGQVRWLGALQQMSKGRLSKETIVLGTFVQGTVVQGDFCPRKTFVQVTVLQGDFCPRKTFVQEDKYLYFCPRNFCYRNEEKI